MKKFLATLRLLIVNLTIASLIQNPFINNAFAANDTAGTISQIGQVFNQFAGTYLSQKQKMSQGQVNPQMLAQMSPACRNANGSLCHQGPSLYFPECPLPASISSMPQNVCMNPQNLSEMLTFEQIANSWTNYYDQMMNKAANAKVVPGLRCLDDRQKAFDSQMAEMQNNLQRLQDQLKKDRENFRNNHKTLIDALDKANDELYGTELNKKNINSKTNHLAKLFSKSCQNVIGNDVMANANQNGLAKISQLLIPVNKSASDFNSNRPMLESELRNDINKIVKQIQDGGLVESGNIVIDSKFSGATEAYKQKFQETQKTVARIQKELKDSLGYDTPTMDRNFTADFQEVINNSDDFFRKKYINECITGKDMGVALPVDDILNNIRQESTGSRGTAVNDYKAALKNILDSDAFIEDKLNQIKTLEGKFKDITVTYKDEYQKRVTESPYSLFMKELDKCQQKYVQNNNEPNKNGQALSQEKKVKRGKDLLQQLKNINDSFANDISQAISEKVLNCNGNNYKSGNKCDASTLSPSESGFCMDHAANCANEIQGCYNEANKLVETKKQEMKNLATKYNQSMDAFYARANQMYEQQKAGIVNMTKLIQAKFPGTNFVLPDDMFVKPPELKSDRYGLPVYGDGDLKQVLDGPESLPEKISKLKDVFKKQQDSVDVMLNEYKQAQSDAMKEQKARWETLGKNCTKAYNTAVAAIEKQNQEGMKKQVEMDDKVAKFCRKYDSIKENPVAACGKASSLAEQADEISARLSNQALSMTNKWANACDSYMNESKAPSEDDCFGKSGDEKTLCLQRIQRDLKNSQNIENKKNKLSLKKICKDDTNDTKLIENILSKIQVDKNTFSEDEKNNFDNFINSKSYRDGELDNSFSENIYELISDKTIPGQTTCEKLLLVQSEGESFNIPSDADQAAKDYYENLKKKLIEKNKELKTILSDFPLPGEKENSKNIDYKAIVSKIGQDTEGPCDAQSNVMAKNPFEFDLNSFDKGYMKTLGK